MLQAAHVPVTLVVMAGGAICLQAYKDDPRVGKRHTNVTLHCSAQLYCTAMH